MSGKVALTFRWIVKFSIYRFVKNQGTKQGYLFTIGVGLIH